MSTVALAINAPSALRIFAPRPRGAGEDLTHLEQRIRELQESFHNSPAITYREAALADTFQNLAEEWRRATRFYSSLRNITTHPAYRAVVDMGDEIVPILLRELHLKAEPWFTALREITGTDPVEPHERGDMQAMADAWLRWGRQRRLIR